MPTAPPPDLRAQYASWPYPAVPLLAAVPSTHLFELHCDWLWDRAGSGPAPARPRVWLAGCGTFQPYVFAVANPHAEIVASDVSEPSLRLAERRCRLHQQRHVRFQACDLADPGSWPAGEFDLIECYGVLMNLRDPLAALRGLAARLSPRGVLRLMVYPHWSRQRVFQIQRVARLLGLHAGDRRHPGRLRAAMRALPKSHPLRYAFTTYQDSRNDAGVVDAFLHQGDRGFTGFQLLDLLQASGLDPAYWFHRPWAQPDAAAAQLGFADRSQAFVLDYLDLWQELRGNFVVCCRRSDAPPPVVQEPRPHPRCQAGDPSLRHRLRLLRLQWLGGRLPLRTSDGDLRLAPAAAQALRRGDPPTAPDHPLWLGGDHRVRLPASEPFPGHDRGLLAASALRVGRRAPNPLYAHLFAAFARDRRHPELRLPDLETQLGRWLPFADPLEERPIAFGLTPYGTALRFRQNLAEHLQRDELPTAPDYAALRLRGDAAALQQVRRWLRDQDGLPTDLPDAALRELWLLLCSHEQLFVTTS